MFKHDTHVQQQISDWPQHCYPSSGPHQYLHLQVPLLASSSVTRQLTQHLEVNWKVWDIATHCSDPATATAANSRFRLRPSIEVKLFQLGHVNYIEISKKILRKHKFETERTCPRIMPNMSQILFRKSTKYPQKETFAVPSMTVSSLFSISLSQGRRKPLHAFFIKWIVAYPK